MSTVFLRVDGEPVEGQGAALATDRGLGYGDGVFRTMRLRAGAIPARALHRAKLVADAGRIGLAIGSEALDRLERDLGDLVAVCSEATVRITVTAGSGPRGYRRSPSTAARILLRAESTDDLPTLAGESVAVRLCDLRLSFQPRLAGVKHLNRLEQVLARAEWDDPATAEGLMLDVEDTLVCGTMSNLFIVEGERLSTPLIDRCGVAGVQRHRILEWARRNGVEAVEQRLSAERLHGEVSVLVSNSVLGVRWVSHVDQRALAGKPTMFDALTEWVDRA